MSARYRFLFTLIAIFITNIALGANVVINGAGATFPYPLYSKWAQIYQAQTGLKINYQSIGSGGGIKQIKSKTVDFGASDKPLTPAELKESGLIQFPTVIGGIVPVVNITGIQSGQLQLSGPVLADIYLGKMKKWNDAAIKSLNPHVNLPDQFITVVHRSDGSGTTFLFSNYLSKVSQTWQSQVGSDVAVAWPAGIGGKGNEGVAAYVQSVVGAIGYVEFAYANQNKLSLIALQNQAGKFVLPSTESFKAAANQQDWQKTPDFDAILTNEPGDNSWPIVGATFILMHALQDQPANATAVLNFFDWGFHQGSATTTDLKYIALPPNVIQLIEDAWKIKVTDKNGKSVWAGR